MLRAAAYKNVAQAKPASVVTIERLKAADVWTYQGPGSGLKELRAGNTIARVWWSEKHVTAVNSQSELMKEYHPRRELVITKYIERKDPFWWNVLSKKDLRPRVVRSWAVNRTRVAFKNALKRRGYDNNGRCLTDIQASQRPQNDIIGTAQFMINEGAVRASWEEMNSQADRILDAFLRGPKGARNERKSPVRSAWSQGREDKLYNGRSPQVCPFEGQTKKQRRPSQAHEQSAVESRMATSTRPSFLDYRNVSERPYRRK